MLLIIDYSDYQRKLYLMKYLFMSYLLKDQLEIRYSNHSLILDLIIALGHLN